MRDFASQYKQLLTPEIRVGRSSITPGNIYRISGYKDTTPPIKVGFKTSYVFVIGEVNGKLHCLLLNHILPENFISLLNRLRNKSKPIQTDQALSELLQIFPRDGRKLFEGYIKSNPKVYSPALDNYRTYITSNIQTIWEIRFEEGILQKIFKEGNTASTRRNEIKKEINEKDG